MPIDILPDKLAVFTREEWDEKYRRSYRLRDPGADMRDGTQPANDAGAMSDQLQILSYNARQMAQGIALSTCTLEQLEERAGELGIPGQLPAVGSSGYVTINAPTGSTIFSGDELSDDASLGLLFQCIRTDTYYSGTPVPVVAITTGPKSNQDAGTALHWNSPRSGCGPSVTVTAQPNGDGLTGGRDEESRDEFEQRISDSLANPAVAGNDAAYQRLMESSKAHGVPVQKAFTIAAALGPGTMGCAVLLKPSKVGAQRIPNPVQSSQVRDYVIGQMPADDGYCEMVIEPQPENIVLDVSWADGAKGWVDSTPWPPRYDPVGTPGTIVATSVTSSTSFVLDCQNGLRTGVIGPTAGKTIGFLNRATGAFSRKKILSVTGTGPWTIVADTTNDASDASYTPLVGQPCCPWSDSLVLLVPTILKHFDGLGPGEQQAVFFDPGLKQKRNPSAPKFWPYAIGNRLAGDLLKESFVQDAVIRQGLGASAAIGVRGTLLYLIELQFITAFPLF